MTDTLRVRLLAQHLKLAFRVLRKAPAFSSLVIAILTLGIGANSVLLTIFGGLGTLLAFIGIYGALTFIVIQRTREIGIRMALGADRKGVLRMIMSEGLLLVGIGMGIGVLAGIVLARVLHSLLFGMQPSDPAVYVMAPLLVSLVAIAACYVPARRATKIEPSIALRYE